MSSPNIPNVPRGLVVRADAEGGAARAALGALASEPRLRILELLSEQLLNMSEIAAALDMPLATTVLHTGILEKAGLITTERRPARRGTQKVCARVYDTVLVQLPAGRRDDLTVLELNMPIGAYTDCRVSPTCGLASEEGIIGFFDDPASFYEPERYRAQLLWFHQGYVEYRFPNRLPRGARLESLSLSLELCSEAPLHHADWPSDIALIINDTELGTWTSPGDFGGQRGVLTPAWWGDQNSQHGLLKVWRVTHEGSFIDGLRLSDVDLETLQLAGAAYLSVRVAVQETRRVGGVNLFGSRFGNYPQDIALVLRFR